MPPVQRFAFSVPTFPKGEGPPRERNGPSWKVLCTCKPGPVPRLRGVSVIYLGSASRRTSIDPPPGIRARDPIRSEERTPVYMVFQPVGFTKPPMSPPALVSSYLTFSSFPALRRVVSLSAALSVTAPFPGTPLPVRKHGTLCCPDFPPPARRREATKRCTGCQGTMNAKG